MCLQDFSKDKIKWISSAFTLHCHQTIPLYNTWYFKLYKIQLNYYTQPKITRGIYVCTYIILLLIRTFKHSSQSTIAHFIQDSDHQEKCWLPLQSNITPDQSQYIIHPQILWRNTDAPVEGEVSAITPNPTQFSVNSSSSTWSRARS